MCPRMKTIKQLSDETGISYSAIYKWCKEEKIVFIRAGKKYLVNVEKFNDFLNGETESCEQQETS